MRQGRLTSHEPFAVAQAERDGQSRTCGRQRLESESRQHARCAHVPRVWDHECAGPPVQCSKLFALRALGLRPHRPP